MSRERRAGELTALRDRLKGLEPVEVVRWAVREAPRAVVVSTNFRPYEAVLLDLCVRVQADMPVLWVDHGFNRPATYRHAEALRRRLGLNLKICLPELSAAHWEAVHGPVPEPGDEAGLQRFSAMMKLEPFRRGMQELAPRIWLTGLRREQNPGRANLAVVEEDPVFGVLKVSPLLEWTDAQLEAYLEERGLPNEWDYYDPAKADEKRECGLHARWGAEALGVRG